MWDWHCRCCFLPKSLLQNQQPLLLPEDDAVCCDYCISFPAIAGMFASWLNRRRIRYLLLILCSPFLVPLLCATCPLICVAEICCFMCRRRRKAADSGDDGRGRRGESGDGGGLLQRYLEDQLSLVVGSEEDGDDCVREGGVDVGYFDSARPLLQ